PGQDYVVQFTDALPNHPWTVLTNVTATGTTSVCYDLATNQRQRYYRVLVASVYPEQVRLTGALQDDHFLLAFTSTPGKTKPIQYKVLPGDWQTLTNITAATTNVSLTASITDQQLLLFRVSAPPD